VILDEKAFCNDFINLAHSIGAYLYEDLLCIVSLRYQTVHILQIRDSGNLVEVRRIGAFCREDDELFLHSHAQVSADVILQLCWIFKYFTSTTTT
jgi:de-etiolated-1